MITIRVGDKEPVGGIIQACDGSATRVECSTYKYLDSAGQELQNGNASAQVFVDEPGVAVEVFVLVQPTVKGGRQRVEFPCTLTPLDGEGQPDATKPVVVKTYSVAVNAV